MKQVVIVVILLAAVLLVSRSLAQGGYGLSSWTADGGGIHAGEGYSLAGTTGQPEAMAWGGDGYTLAGGFWPAGAASPGSEYMLFLPLVMREP
jgi:hypothetical protein